MVLQNSRLSTSRSSRSNLDSTGKMRKHSLYIDAVLKVLRTTESLFAAINLHVGDLKLYKQSTPSPVFSGLFCKNFYNSFVN